MQHLLNRPLRVMASVGVELFTWEASLLMAEGDRLVISRPARKGIKLRVQPGQCFDMFMPTPDGLLALHGSVVEATLDRLTLLWPDAPNLHMIQRRHHVRLAVETACTVEMAPDPLWGAMPGIDARLTDVSEGGCGLEVAEDLLDELPLKISFSLSQQGPLQLTGAVAHVTALAPARHRIGIRFTNMVPEAIQALRDYAQKRTGEALN